jgi:hypothetical protein
MRSVGAGGAGDSTESTGGDEKMEEDSSSNLEMVVGQGTKEKQWTEKTGFTSTGFVRFLFLLLGFVSFLFLLLGSLD